MSEPKKCPCCDGWGKREAVSGNQPVWAECPACNGEGVLWPRDYGLSIPYAIRYRPIDKREDEANAPA